MTALTYTVRDYTVRETAAEIRKALRGQWPGVKFSVRMSRGTGHGWLHCGWTDGPREGQIRAVTDGFRSSRFDGMDDSYHSIPATMYAAPDGTITEHRYTCCGVNGSRGFSPEVEAWAEAVAVRGSYWWPNGCDAWQDSQHHATRSLLAGLDLSGGIPDDPRAAYAESWQR